MFAIRQYEVGPAENLRYEEVPDPQPNENQVRITVSAIGVHLADTTIRKGQFWQQPDLPMTPGREVAGVVTAGHHDWLGQRVVAHLGLASGGYAELAVADVAALHRIPDNVSDEAAVAAIGTGRTTIGILDAAQLRSTDKVLVTSAAGGIGAFVTQEARNVGATVIGLAGGTKLKYVLDNGADAAIDYTASNWADDLKDITVVFDGVGGAVGDQTLKLLAPGGRTILYGWASGEPTKITTEVLYANSLTATVALGPGLVRRGLRTLETEALDAVKTGRFVPLINPPFSLREAAKAHEALESRATVGKVVLKP